MNRFSRVAALPLISAAALSAALMLNPAPAAASTLAFSAHGVGPFEIGFTSGGLLEETQTLAFDSFLPFPLTSGEYRDDIDPSQLNPDGSTKFPDAVVFSTFTLSDGVGDSLFGSYTVETSNFTDPVDPFSGDFIGAQDFGGHFTFTGGTGEYAGATGGGVYTGHGDFLDPGDSGALLAGIGEYTATGHVDFVPEPTTWALMLAGFGLTGAALRRRRRAWPATLAPADFRKISLGATFVVALAASSAAAAATYDAAGDFSIANGNPNGAWAYGYGVLGQSFTADATQGAQWIAGDATPYWKGPDTDNYGIVLRNDTGSDFTFSNILLAAGGLIFHPGQVSDTIVQWTAATAGLYHYSTTFEAVDFAQNTGLIVGMFLNADPIAGMELTSPGDSFTQSGDLMLAAGDTLSFGVNNDGDWAFDSTAFSATISGAGVPEPATWGLMLAGFGLTGAALRRRRRRTALSGAVVASLAVVALATPASATILTATYRGTVSNGYDQTGVFGTAGADLTGLAYTSVYTVDDAAPGSQTYTDATVSQLSGGSVYGSTSPVSAVLTIGGHSLSFAPGFLGLASQQSDIMGAGVGDDIGHSAFVSHTEDPGTGSHSDYFVVNEIVSYVNDFVTSTDYHTPLDYVLQPGSFEDGFFRDEIYDGVGHEDVRYNFAYFTTDSVTISVAQPGVPEPATWALMLLGFGGLGAAMRQRRRSALAAARG